jgi:hypothetical protein
VAWLAELREPVPWQRARPVTTPWQPLHQQTGLISENAFRYPSLKMISPTGALRHSNSCYAQAMEEEQPNAGVAIGEYIESLKSRIPASEHALWIPGWRNY